MRSRVGGWRLALVLLAALLPAVLPVAAAGGRSAPRSAGLGAGMAVQRLTPTDSSTVAATALCATGAAACSSRFATAASCASDDWATYGHDAARTGASGGCVSGPLTTAFRYVPSGTLAFIDNAIADSGGAYLHYAFDDAPFLGSPAIDRVSSAGQHGWTFVGTFGDGSPVDTDLGNWPSLAFGHVAMNEDGIYWMDPATGQNVFTTNATVGNDGQDLWGQTTPEVGGIAYEINTQHADGFPLKVTYRNSDGSRNFALFNQTATPCRLDSTDATGALAVDGLLFIAADYKAYDGAPNALAFAAGIYALDATNGAEKWFQPAAPAGGISASGGLLYSVESTGLVARAESDGSPQWSAALPGLSRQAPVIAGGLVIVAAADAVHAFAASTGLEQWSRPVSGAAAPDLRPLGRGACGNNNLTEPPVTFLETTTLAAALGSGTLVVTAADGIHVLLLSDGSEQWQGSVPQAQGQLRNPVVVGSTLYVEDGPMAAPGGGLLALVMGP